MCIVSGMWQVQPDLEELEPNMEENEETESSKEDMHLGKLHFSMDYDFTKSEVSRSVEKVAMTRLLCTVLQNHCSSSSCY